MLTLDRTEIAIFKQLQAYIEEHYVPSRYRKIDEDNFYDRIFDIRKVDWDKKLDKNQNEFCTHILAYFNEDYEQLRDCCMRACISKASYIKMCEKSFSPSKECVCKIAIAANLNFDCSLKVFHTANIHLYEHNKFDVVMMFFLENGIFDFRTVNKILYLLDIPMLCYSFV